MPAALSVMNRGIWARTALKIPMVSIQRYFSSISYFHFYNPISSHWKLLNLGFISIDWLVFCCFIHDFYIVLWLFNQSMAAHNWTHSHILDSLSHRFICTNVHVLLLMLQSTSKFKWEMLMWALFLFDR